MTTPNDPRHAPTDDVRSVFDGARVLVTGGAGFLGSWLCERLVGEGALVHGVDSLVTGDPQNLGDLLGHPSFTFSRADVTEHVPVPGRVDQIFHLASPASPVQYHRLPLETLRTGAAGTENALEVARRHGARFLYASTSEVYGDPEVHPQPEDYRGSVDPVGPRSVYDEAKRFGEALTAAYRRHHGTDTAIVRIFNTYGPRMSREDGRVVPTLLGQATAGRPLTVAGDGSQTRSLCWVGDTVDGLVRMAASGEAGPVNIGSDEEISVLELALLIQRLTGSDSPVTRIPLPEGDPARRRPDLDRARRLLGWEPRTPLRDGLGRTLAWLRALDRTGVPAAGMAGRTRPAAG